MADHNVTVNYGPGGFQPDLDPIRVKQGQTIAFKLGQARAERKLRLTFQDRQFFATSHPQFAQTGVFDQGDGDVRIVAAPFQVLRNIAASCSTRTAPSSPRAQRTAAWDDPGRLAIQATSSIPPAVTGVEARGRDRRGAAFRR